MALSRHGRGPGLREVTALWALYAVVSAEVFATYSRLEPHALYHVTGNGRAAGASRAIVFLNWPVALAAIPMLAVVAAEAHRRVVSRLALVAAVLCAAVFWPGMVTQANLDARWANAIAAIGVLLALGLTVATLLRRGLGPRTRARGDRIRLAILVVLVLLSLPWLGADLGFLIGRWPLLGSVYYSDEWYAPFGHARPHEAVHTGNHHGLVGALLVVTVLLLSRTLGSLAPRLRLFVGAYLAVLGLYGLANIANDFWLEQIVKRGVTNWELPSMVVPKPSVPWLILLVVAAALYVFVFRRLEPARPSGDGTPRALLVATPLVFALLVIGLGHGPTTARTQLGAADGIVFAAAPSGTSHLYVTRSGGVVQLTDADGTDLAPAWSPDRHLLAFQSNRDGNWELYVMRVDGTHVRRVTRDAARDGEPSWSPDGRELAFTRNGHLYAIHADGTGLRSLGRPGEWPAWSPDGKTLAAGGRRPAWSSDGRRIAFECRVGTHWRVCVMTPSRRNVRYLTPRDSDSFAPVWSPDGERIAFVSDRDGPDELFVMQADGTKAVRLTNAQMDIDTPTWSRR